MKLRNLLFATVAVTALCSCAYSVGKTTERSFDLTADYEELEVSNAINVVYSSTAETVTVEAGENVIDDVMIKRDKEELKIYLKPSENRFKGNVGTITVTLPASSRLEQVSLSGASSFVSDKLLEAREFEVGISGASSFSADIAVSGSLDVTCGGASSFTSAVSAAELDIVVRGASRANVSGRVGQAEIEASGASSLAEKDEARLEAVTAECSVSGASRVNLHCTGFISGHASGASSVRCSGEARSSVSASGASSFSRD